ncbi:hypothetical protein [Kribbella sp. HUAS MG21]|uniref:Uncharacterized protein n=1 Tax=Kribbella sp. HUAS MG21 TaxID=3160966 RepID=A0AAU7TMP7_9ACTN
MPWQLWVVIALAVAALVLLAAARMRHARKVFDDITTLDRPADPAESGVDELARARARHVHPEPHRKHG